MTNHDSLKEFLENKELIEKISPKFNELTLDIQEIFKYSENPMFVSVLLFKLAEERKRTNQLLEELNEKYDKLMFEFKTKGMQKTPEFDKTDFEILPEQDQQILSLVENKGSVTAEEVQMALRYKGRNAASQRLNKLFKEGCLKKVQSGKKVLYLAKNM